MFVKLNLNMLYSLIILFNIDICPAVKESEQKHKPQDQEYEATPRAHKVSELTSVFPFGCCVTVWCPTFTRGIIVILFGYGKSNEKPCYEPSLMPNIMTLPVSRQPLIHEHEETRHTQ